MIKKISLQNFRKYKNISIDTPYNLIILVGPNASGKTTIIESIYLCSTSKSFRSQDYKEMILDDSPFSKISISADKKFEIILSEKGKKTSINRIEMKKISDFIGHLRTVLFAPNDLQLIYGEKSLRRNFFDLEISLMDKNYLKNINEYKKLVKKRNELLKSQDIDDVLLSVITDEMILRESEIMVAREKFIKLLNYQLEKLDSRIGINESIRLSYAKSISGDLKKFYESKLQYDKITKMTNYGVHRDDYIFYTNDKISKIYCSQGQVRSAVIALKIALFNLIKDITKTTPILLLDDVFSELDLDRQKCLVSFLLNEPQTFITTTNLNGIPKEILNKSHIINLKE